MAALTLIRGPTITQPMPCSWENLHIDSPRSKATSTWRTGGACAWVAMCFEACIVARNSDNQASSNILSAAADEFVKLLVKRDPLLLAAVDVLRWNLSYYYCDEISREILASVHEAAERYSTPGDPVRLIIKYNRARLSLALKTQTFHEIGITSSTIHHLYRQLHDWPGPSHPCAISVSYHFAWALKYEGQFSEAEAALKESY